MSPASLRSGCPIHASLEVFGDKWSLLILRDLIYFGKNSFSGFLSSDEGIARNILVARLRQLQDDGIIVKKEVDSDSRKHRYELTLEGLDVIPVLLTLANWGRARVSAIPATDRWFEAVRTNREAVEACARATVQKGGAIFQDAPGCPSVVTQLGLMEAVKS